MALRFGADGGALFGAVAFDVDLTAGKEMEGFEGSRLLGERLSRMGEGRDDLTVKSNVGHALVLARDELDSQSSASAIANELAHLFELVDADTKLETL